jgi:hypothetical protein
MFRRHLLTLAAAGMALACGDDPSSPNQDGQRPADGLTIVRFDEARFQTVQKTGSFWAVKGESREITLLYGDSSGSGSDEFLEFEVDDDALLTRPDGTPFLEGDSVLITVTVDPGGEFLFDFQPSGLRFNPAEPAELEINYNLADPDLNRDGVVDGQDLVLREAISIWQAERPDGLFTELFSVRVREDEIRADVGGFTTFTAAN